MNWDGIMNFLSELWLTPGGFLFAIIIGWVVEVIFAICSQYNIADAFRAFSIIWKRSPMFYFELSRTDAKYQSRMKAISFLKPSP